MAALNELADLQTQFLQALRTPLTVRAGRLVSDLRLEPSLLHQLRDTNHLSAADAFAVYHRQYWFRLFGVVQSDYPLVAGLLGLFACNLVALEFFAEQPPRGNELHSLTAGFAAFVLERAPQIDRVALHEAVRIDGAVRHALAAPAPSASDRIGLAPSWTLVEEHWPLLELRRSLVAAPCEARTSLPPRLALPQWWAVGAAHGQAAMLRLEAEQHLLYELLGEFDLVAALAELEHRVEPSRQAQLPANVERWLALGRRHGLIQLPR